MYYEIRGWFHCLFRGPQSLTNFFKYTDQRCLALYIQETLKHRAQILQPPTRPTTTQKITEFFNVLPSTRGTKRSPSLTTDSISKSVTIRGFRTTRPQQHDRSKAPPERHSRSAKHQKRHCNKRHASTSTSSGQQTLLNFPQFSSFDLGC